MSKARERQQKRRSRREQMVRKAATGSNPRQTQRADRVQLPSIQLPRNPLVYLVPTGIIIMLVVIYVLGLIFGDNDETYPNAIWLNRSWTYSSRDDADLRQFVDTLRQHRVGTIYAFTSSLTAEGGWSGRSDGRNQFSEVETNVSEFVVRFKEFYPEAEIYAWIEIQTNIGAVSLADEGTQATIAEFSRQAITRLDMDGVLLDIKPLLTANPDVPPMVRAVRRSIGMDTPLAIAVQPDLTPDVETLQPLAQIAPGTAWTPEFRQQIALQADQLVLTPYHSYRTNPLDYINWVAYQVDTYIAVLDDLGAIETRLIISLPSYAESLPAHDPNVESLAAALDGVNIALDDVDPEEQPYVQGIAIYTDSDLTSSQWQVIDDKWRPQQR